MSTGTIYLSHDTLFIYAAYVYVRPPAGSISCTGFFKNYNTIEEFKAADKAALFNQVAEQVR